MSRQGDAEIKHILDRLRVLVNDPKTLLGVIDNIEELLLAKGDDYSGREDAFANFSRIADIMTEPEDKIFMVLIAVKLGRLYNMFRTLFFVKPKFESMWDTVQDLLGYLILWLAYAQKQGVQDEVHPDSSD